MTMTLIVGKPGAGKSLTLMKEYIVPAARGKKAMPGRRGLPERPGVAKRHVVTNVPVILERIERDFPELMGMIHVVGEEAGNTNPHAKVENLEAWAEDLVNEDGVGPLFVWDEAHLAYAKGRLTQQLLDFYTLHRHHAIDVILATQQVSQLNRDLAGLCEVYIILKRDRGWGGGNNKTSRWVYDGYPKGALLKNETGVVHDRRYFGTYRSTYSAALKESEPKIRSWWLSRPMLAVYASFTLSALFIVFYGAPAVLRVFTGSGVAERVAAREAAAAEEMVKPPDPPTAAVAPEGAVVPVANPVPGSLPVPAMPSIGVGTYGEPLPASLGVVADFQQSLEGLTGPSAPAPSPAPSWTIHGWVAYVKDGEWTCEARFRDSSGDQVKPWAMKARLKWKSIETEWDPDEALCTVTIDEGVDGREPFIDVAQVGG